MKKENIAEIAIGVILGGLVLVVVSGLFSGWLAKHGMNITGVVPTTKVVAK